MSGCKVQSTHKTLLQNILVVHPDIIGLLYMYNFFTLAFLKKIVKKIVQPFILVKHPMRLIFDFVGYMVI